MVALSHEREFTVWLPSQPLPSLLSGGGTGVGTRGRMGGTWDVTSSLALSITP